MRINPGITPAITRLPDGQSGFTLIELLVFIVVVSIGLGALFSVYNQSVGKSVDPVVRVRLLELAQSQLDEILARKYDENTPTGGVPACGAGTGPLCAGFGLDGEDITNADTLDDVDDFDGYTDFPYPSYVRKVVIVSAGAELGLVAAEAKRILVTVTAPGGEYVQLSAYRTNF